ncbi:diaminopimelate epimerase [Tissierella sp.]|uniref:diaminopimelate epimerase n=1 Tax=Tissierella sp. TaxID=41274 RepID=UPI003F951ADB
MRLNFVKVNPVENMTIFIMDQIPRKEHKTVSNRIMDYNNLHAEQVGFIEKADDKEGIRLQMMGGEFCGNATRSLAALLVDKGYPQVKKEENKLFVDLEVSGMKGKIQCEVEKIEENKYLSKIEMPAPRSIKEDAIEFEEKTLEFARVNFEGITHFIVDKNKIKNKDLFYKTIKESLKETDYEAFGIMYYDFKKDFMEPLVYVRSTDSLFWERSCASGTCAFGAYRSHENKENINIDVKQPGGSLSVNVEYKNDSISHIYLNGQVEIVAEGTLYV